MLPSPLLGRGAGDEGQSTFDLSLQLSLPPKGRAFFTGREGQLQRKAAGQLPLTPDPSPQRGRGERGHGFAVFENLTQRHQVLKSKSPIINGEHDPFVSVISVAKTLPVNRHPQDTPASWRQMRQNEQSRSSLPALTTTARRRRNGAV